MNELVCPNCQKLFKLDDSGYSEISKQVRDIEFKNALNERLELAEREKITAIQLAEVKKDAEIFKLKTELEGRVTSEELAITNAIAKINLENAEILKKKNEEIEYYKDYKARLSTKMVGETLEQHCEIEFEKIRPLGFPRAYFDKEKYSKFGSKGDYVFRDYDDDGLEFVSIMFEMKNENETTATKKKNEDFLKELDKDRNEKNCEYAVLVSLLEMDSDLYNTGIVDVSHKYPKMYVVRPQFFIPIITLLRNAAGNTAHYKAELQRQKNQNIDITNFENELEDFKTSFGRNVKLFSDKFKTAIDEIDKTIDHLEKTKKALIGSDDNLRRANNKAEEITIKRLTRNNPTMKSKFLELENKNPRALDSGIEEEISED